MDRNLLLAFALSFLVLALWSSLQKPPPPGQDPQGDQRTEATEPGAPPWESEAPADPDAAVEPVPEPMPEAGEPGAMAGTDPAPAAATEREPARAIEVSTDLWDAVLTTRGGGILEWTLDEYREERDPASQRLTLTTFDASRQLGLATPFDGLGRGDLSHASYQAERPDRHTVAFTRQVDGVTLRKTYLFEPDSYSFRLRIALENRSQQTVQTRLAVRWPGSTRQGSDFSEHGLIALHDGGVERARWAMPAAMACAGGGGGADDATFEREVDWVGEETRYFLAVMLPELPRDATARFLMGADEESGAAEIGYLPIPVPPGQSISREYRVYIGPKEPERLDALSAHLDRAVNIGWAWIAPLAKFFSWLLRAFHSVVPNYGLAIILITILVRLVTAPLTQKQMRSMKRLGELQPKIKELQEKYKDDRQRQSQEMMNLYRTAGVNPLGGCLPMVLQFPVFIGLFYALQSSIHLRQAPFVGWIDDLSVPETLFIIPGLELPFRVLPILMGVSMVAQQKLTPSTMDPAQARMMLTVMPVMFTVLFYGFPSGLVLYWFVSNLLAILHQVWMNRSR